MSHDLASRASERVRQLDGDQRRGAGGRRVGAVGTPEFEAVLPDCTVVPELPGVVPTPDSAAISMRTIAVRHLPQSVPAAQRSPISSTLRAPEAITFSMVRRVTTIHRQIYTVPASPPRRG